MKHLLYLIMCSCLYLMAEAQNYKAVKSVAYGDTLHRSRDTLWVQKISPDNLKQLVQQHEKLIVLIYKPYCKSLISDFAPYANFIRAAQTKGYRIAFIAGSAYGVPQIHTHFIHPYQLYDLMCYMIQDDIYKHKMYEKALSTKKIKNVLIFEKGILKNMLWGYKLKPADETLL